MDEIASPHDTFFRESFSRREIATDFLRWHLPADLLAEIDLDTLEIGKDSYVSSDLRSAYSDLVYRVQHRDGPLSVYLLFEHKSRPEHWTLLQLLRYITAEGEQHRKRYYVQGTQRIEETDIRQLLRQSTKTGEPIMQTFIDRYIEQGMKEGMQQGMQQGEAAVVLRLIERRFGPLSDDVRQRVTQADPNTLLQWSERILDANSLEEVLH
jgi:hypothetical protein